MKAEEAIKILKDANKWRKGIMLRIEYKFLSIGCKLKKAIQFYQMWLKWCDTLNAAAQKRIDEALNNFENNLKT
jgi:hypothetical protein